MKPLTKQDKFIDDTGRKILKELIKENDKYGGLPIFCVMNIVFKVIKLTIKFCNKNGK